MPATIKRRLAQCRSIGLHSFGKGNPSGLIAPEMAKGACVAGDLIPTFALGIPGSPTTAILMAALIVHGIRPGRDFFKGQLPYVVLAGVLLAQFCFFIIGLVSAKYWAKVIALPNGLLVPAIAVLARVGAYADSNKVEAMFMQVFFGVFGYVMPKNKYPTSPLLPFPLGRRSLSEAKGRRGRGFGGPGVGSATIVERRMARDTASTSLHTESTHDAETHSHALLLGL